MSFYGLLLGALGVWRLTHLFVAENGPWRAMARLRQLASGGFFGSLLDCFYCLSLWIALPFAIVLGDGLLERALLWPALSGAAILLERVSQPSAGAAPATYSEDKEPSNGMLR